jgi:hypothetical protein
MGACSQYLTPPMTGTKGMPSIQLHSIGEKGTGWLSHAVFGASAVFLRSQFRRPCHGLRAPSIDGCSGAVARSFTHYKRRLQGTRGTTLPESPQHQRWTQARTAAAERIAGFRGDQRDALEDAISALEDENEDDSATWFDLSERLHQSGRRLASAIHCLREWPEPDDSHPDSDDDAPYRQRARRPDTRVGQRVFVLNSRRRLALVRPWIPLDSFLAPCRPLSQRQKNSKATLLTRFV